MELDFKKMNGLIPAIIRLHTKSLNAGLHE